MYVKEGFKLYFSLYSRNSAHGFKPLGFCREFDLMSEWLFFACLFIKIKEMIEIMVNSYRNDKILFHCFALGRSENHAVSTSSAGNQFLHQRLSHTHVWVLIVGGLLLVKQVPTNVEDKKTVAV